MRCFWADSDRDWLGSSLEGPHAGLGRRRPDMYLRCTGSRQVRVRSASLDLAHVHHCYAQLLLGAQGWVIRIWSGRPPAGPTSLYTDMYRCATGMAEPVEVWPPFDFWHALHSFLSDVSGGERWIRSISFGRPGARPCSWRESLIRRHGMCRGGIVQPVHGLHGFHLPHVRNTCRKHWQGVPTHN